MLEILIVSLALVGAVLWRILLSRPPKGGVPGGRASIRVDAPAAATLHATLERSRPSPAVVLGAPPALPLTNAIERTPALPAPPVPVSIVGVEIDRADDERQLWLLVRERLARRRGGRAS